MVIRTIKEIRQGEVIECEMGILWTEREGLSLEIVFEHTWLSRRSNKYKGHPRNKPSEGRFQIPTCLVFIKTPKKSSEETHGLWGGRGLQVYSMMWGSGGALSSGDKS